MEIRVNVDTKFMNALLDKLLIDNMTVEQTIVEALGLYDWAVTQASNGKIIVASNPDGSESKELLMPTLFKLLKDYRREASDPEYNDKRNRRMTKEEAS